MEWNKGAMAACETEGKFGLAVVLLTAEGLPSKLASLALSRRARLSFPQGSEWQSGTFVEDRKCVMLRWLFLHATLKRGINSSGGKLEPTKDTRFMRKWGRARRGEEEILTE